MYTFNIIKSKEDFIMVNKVKRVLKNTAVFAAVMLLVSGGGALSV